jgi:hypothetical protein
MQPNYSMEPVMKKILALVAIAATLGFTTGTTRAQDVLTGEPKLACEAILCLSSGTRPSECLPSIAHYFGIKMSKPWKTVEARLNFLNQCPVVGQSAEMKSLASAIANGAGQCDALALNSALAVVVDDGMGGYFYSSIGNRMPDYCGAYINHPYTDLSSTGPRYVGKPERGGYWVDAQNYDSAVATYNTRIQQEDAARQNAWSGYWGN